MTALSEKDFINRIVVSQNKCDQIDFYMLYLIRMSKIVIIDVHHGKCQIGCECVTTCVLSVVRAPELSAGLAHQICGCLSAKWTVKDVHSLLHKTLLFSKCILTVWRRSVPFMFKYTSKILIIRAPLSIYLHHGPLLLLAPDYQW